MGLSNHTDGDFCKNSLDYFSMLNLSISVAPTIPFYKKVAGLSLNFFGVLVDLARPAQVGYHPSPRCLEGGGAL